MVFDLADERAGSPAVFAGESSVFLSTDFLSIDSEPTDRVAIAFGTSGGVTSDAGTYSDDCPVGDWPDGIVCVSRAGFV